MRSLAIFLVLIAVITLQKSYADEVDMSAQWTVELSPGANPEAVARSLGFEYEGKHPTLPNIHLFRLQTQHQTRDVHPIKVAAHQDVVWSEAQIPRERARRDRL